MHLRYPGAPSTPVNSPCTLHEAGDRQEDAQRSGTDRGAFRSAHLADGTMERWQTPQGDLEDLQLPSPPDAGRFAE